MVFCYPHYILFAFSLSPSGGLIILLFSALSFAGQRGFLFFQKNFPCLCQFLPPGLYG